MPASVVYLYGVRGLPCCMQRQHCGISFGAKRVEDSPSPRNFNFAPQSVPAPKYAPKYKNVSIYQKWPAWGRYCLFSACQDDLI